MSSAIDLDAAAARLAGVVRKTPVMRSRLLDERVGAEVYLKAEHLQRTGAKVRRRGCSNGAGVVSNGKVKEGVHHFF